MRLTKSVTYIRQGDVDWFEEIFEEYTYEKNPLLY
ncbi:Uncharacterised protein [Streptococcus pneumoniae]|nr:Uncharacterised protein [Streptococcus pneumoniae]